MNMESMEEPLISMTEDGKTASCSSVKSMVIIFLDIHGIVN